MEDENVVDGQKGQYEPEAGDIAVEEGDDGVDQDGQEAAQMKEGKDRVEQRPSPGSTAPEGAGLPR